MTDETKNLKLFKYNTRTDRKEKFSVDDALNDNWDKVDEAVNANKESIAEVKEEVAGIKANKGVPGGYAGLNAQGKVPTAQLPELGVSNYKDLVGKPTKLSDFVDDLGNAPVHTHSQYLTSHQDLSGKQDVLVAGEGIKIVGNTISSTVKAGASEEELALKEDKANKGVANGYAGLDAEGKVPKAQLPELGTSNYEDLVGKPTKLSDFVDDLGNAPVHTHGQYLTSHQNISGKEDKANKGVANGYAELDDTGKVPTAQLPELGVSNYKDLVGKPTKLSDFVDDLGNAPVHTHSQYLTSHQNISGKEDKANKGVPGGYAGLDADGKVPTAQLPELGVSNYKDLVGKPTNLSDFVDDLGNAPVHTHEQYLTQHQDLSGKANVDMSNVSADVLKNLIGAGGSGSSGGVKETYISEDKNSSWVWFDNGLLIQWIHIPSRQYPFTSESGDFGAVFHTPTPIDYSLLKDYTNTAYYANLHPYNARGDLKGAQTSILPKGTKQVSLAVLSLDSNNTGIPAVVDIITVGYCDPTTT